MQRHTIFTMLAVVAMVAPGFGVMPTAEAHICASYDRRTCDPEGCRPGEDHDHKYDGEGGPQRCQSVGPQKPPCRMYEWEPPRLVCYASSWLPEGHLLLA